MCLLLNFKPKHNGAPYSFLYIAYCCIHTPIDVNRYYSIIDIVKNVSFGRKNKIFFLPLKVLSV